MTVAMETKLFNYPFKFFVYGTLSSGVTVLVGYLVSLVFPNRKDLTGLTVWTKVPSTSKKAAGLRPASGTVDITGTLRLPARSHWPRPVVSAP